MTWTSDPQVWFFDDLPLSLRENIRLIHVCDRSLKNQQCWKHLLSKWNKKGSKFRLIFFAPTFMTEGVIFLLIPQESVAHSYLIVYISSYLIKCLESG